MANRNVDFYRARGREAYDRGRVIFPAVPPARQWQRRAFLDGYAEARAEWRAKHPRADEWAHAAKRSARFCRVMVRRSMGA